MKEEATRQRAVGRADSQCGEPPPFLACGFLRPESFPAVQPLGGIWTSVLLCSCYFRFPFPPFPRCCSVVSVRLPENPPSTPSSPDSPPPFFTSTWALPTHSPRLTPLEDPRERVSRLPGACQAEAGK